MYFAWIFRHALLTDYYLQVKNSNGRIYAMGDCCTIEQRKLFSDVKEIFTAADKDADGKLSLEEFKGKYIILSFLLTKCLIDDDLRQTTKNMIWRKKKQAHQPTFSICHEKHDVDENWSMAVVHSRTLEKVNVCEQFRSAGTKR